jgi:hypothetical protein
MLLLSSLLLLISVVTAAVFVTAACITGKACLACAKIFSAGSACVGNFFAQAQPAWAIF